ncbi:probable serine/threonine-protein kinase nek3 [Eurosta solidaginis]|uniref:probable serine/threonine-protein kinase nek3 n=1 Tax=Eurosta solidaginis TaxID=178769 RepID=UPI0035307D9D
MKVKVILCFYICCLLQQEIPYLVNAESNQNATSSTMQSASNGTNIITNFQIKNTTNVTIAQLQEVANSTENKESGKYKSRKIANTENAPAPPIGKQILINKANKTTSDRKALLQQQHRKDTTKLTMVASNVLLDVNKLKSQPSYNVNANASYSKNTTASKEVAPNVIDLNALKYNETTVAVKFNQTINAKNSYNKTLPISTPIAKVDHDASVSNNTEELKSNSSVKNETSTTTTKTTTTTTTTTTKPKKPAITLGLGDFPHLPGEPIPTKKTTYSKLPTSNDISAPNAEPSQEMNSGFNYHRSRDFIVPIMTVLFTIPLVCGVVITTYRRFRDCWSTRHYRRMDFLVDGMYND